MIRRPKASIALAAATVAAATLAALLVTAWTPAFGATRAAQRHPEAGTEPTVTLNFPEAEIESVSRAMAAVLGRPILVDPRVKGKVTLYTEEPVTTKQAYAMYLSALRGMGMAVVESAGLLRVVPEADGKVQTGTVALAPARSPGGDQIATQVFRIVNENATNLVAVLRPLITPNNTINVNPGNNTLVVTDYQSNLERLSTLITALDTPSATDVEVIPLQYAVAADLATTVTRLTDTSGTSGTSAAASPAAGGAAAAATTGPVSVMADTKLNALLVKAANPTRLAAIRALVARLDRPGGSGSGGSNVHVVYLKNAEATRLATVLRASFPLDPNRGSSGSTGGTVVASSGGGGGGASGAVSSGGTTGTASTQSTTPVSAAAQPTTGGYIQADPATNSLIITAPAPLMREIQAVVDDLDATRAQVYVESLVVEVDASKARALGVQWEQIYSLSKTSTITLGSIVEALDSMSGTNVLSTANLVTLDNEEARIVVGQNVPFVTGSYTTTSGTATNPFQTVERKDVGITLRIRPQISANGTVRMTIFQEASSVADTVAAGTTNAGPTTNKRSVETNVVVKDGNIVVIGGLIEDSYTASASDLPGFASIPWIGPIFRTMGRTRQKTNLLVFLRPVVLRDETALNALSQDRYDSMRIKQRELPEDPRQVLPRFVMPELPAPSESAPSPAPASRDSPTDP